MAKHLKEWKEKNSDKPIKEGMAAVRPFLHLPSLTSSYPAVLRLQRCGKTRLRTPNADRRPRPRRRSPPTKRTRRSRARRPASLLRVRRPLPLLRRVCLPLFHIFYPTMFTNYHLTACLRHCRLFRVLDPLFICYSFLVSLAADARIHAVVLLLRVAYPSSHPIPSDSRLIKITG